MWRPQCTQYSPFSVQRSMPLHLAHEACCSSVDASNVSSARLGFKQFLYCQQSTVDMHNVNFARGHHAVFRFEIIIAHNIGTGAYCQCFWQYLVLLNCSVTFAFYASVVTFQNDCAYPFLGPVSAWIDIGDSSWPGQHTDCVAYVLRYLGHLRCTPVRATAADVNHNTCSID